jgi:1-acyl-sn-glycerol-3-phosphate acyltransferase
MQIGFNLPVSGPMATPATMARMARLGEEMGFDYLTLTDHVALPDTSTPGYPYSETGEFYSPSPGIRLEVLGREHLPRGAALIASRHQSAFDTMVWLTLVPRCCYVLKHELLRIPLFGKLIQATRMIAVDRTGGGATLRSLVRQGERAVREARQIVIFPEGTRSPPDSMLPLQPGVAALASRTGLAVIPVVTNSGSYWGRRAFRKRPGTIRMVIRPPLPVGLPRHELMVRLCEQFTIPLDAAGRPVDNSVGGAFPNLSGRPK